MGSFANAMGGIRDESRDRSENDYYPTPPFATYSLIKHERDRGNEVPQTLHEPACGRGWMAYELRRLGKDVVASDLYPYTDEITDTRDGQDFLKLEDAAAEGMITNPPYAKNMAQKFVEHALDINYEYVAVLVRTMFSESGTRYPFFIKRPPTSIMYFAQRFSCSEHMFFTKPLSGMVPFSWWVWDYRYGKTTETDCSWINTKEMHTEWTKQISEGELRRLGNLVLTPKEEPEEQLDSSNLFQMMEERS